ncbi:uncharacterized protein LOC132755706 [Ruditapes philippinarum]|uniref:uncharacterized protein LOC132755706 n=1 Tax=Ruditapes philippinarum TaxID=129788 RepID=UPI00295A6B58|nr:uncharacterized protein LOC132755706 [Ruditapes philippinarum]
MADAMLGKSTSGSSSTQKTVQSTDNVKETTDKGKKLASTKKTPVKSSSSTVSNDISGFNREALMILRDMNNNINKTNEKVESLTSRIDHLYEYQSDDYSHGYFDYDGSNYDDNYDNGIDSEGLSEEQHGSKRPFSEVEQDEDDDNLFSSFVKKFKRIDTVDNEVDQKLADLINTTFREGMQEDNLSDISKSIFRPSNCEALKETRVNPGVWSVLKPVTQTEDSKLRGIQNLVIKASCNVAKMLDKGASDFDKQMLEWGTSALGLLGQSNKWINIRRRELHRKDMDPKLHYLCSPSLPYTDMLYGDSMIKDIKDIQELNKISRQVMFRGRPVGRGFGRFNSFSRGRRPFRRGGAYRFPFSAKPKSGPRKDVATYQNKNFKAV